LAEFCITWEVLLTDYVLPVAVVYLARSEIVFLNGLVHVRGEGFNGILT
jgi:hypothetical protein